MHRSTNLRPNYSRKSRYEAHWSSIERPSFFEIRTQTLMASSQAVLYLNKPQTTAGMPTNLKLINNMIQYHRHHAIPFGLFVITVSPILLCFLNFGSQSYNVFWWNYYTSLYHIYLNEKLTIGPNYFTSF